MSTTKSRFCDLRNLSTYCLIYRDVWSSLHLLQEKQVAEADWGRKGITEQVVMNGHPAGCPRRFDDVSKGAAYREHKVNE